MLSWSRPDPLTRDLIHLINARRHDHGDTDAAIDTLQAFIEQGREQDLLTVLAALDEEIREIIGPLFWLKVSLLMAVIWASVKIKRPFCRFICPLGAVYSPFNRISALRMTVHEKCVKCDACREVCPVDMSIYEGPNSGVCIRCMKCTGCSAVGVSFLGKDIIKAGRDGKIGRAAYEEQR